MRTGSGVACAVLLLAVAACGSSDEADARLERSGMEAAQGIALLDVALDPLDSLIFVERMSMARDQRLADMEIGDVITVLGRAFVGAPYTAGTLELDGPERLVVNLRELDCVTFIESVLAMARVVRAGTPDFESYKRELVRIRYRDGVLSGYPSRLHYFSEWIANNEEKGLVRDITASLGGRQAPGPIDFMTRNRDAYRQLADSAVFVEIEELEAGLTGSVRHYIPETSIDAIAHQIQDGDIIAATSTLEGLDVAHTGIAIWVDGRLHLMHAPLVGTVVEISPRPLAERLRGISSQNGIMVARPL